MVRKKRILLRLLLGITFLLVVTTAPVQARTGTVALESISIAAGLGVKWGEGRLIFDGKEYAFSVNGLSVADVGISKVSASGTVTNLYKVSDFPGTYVAVSAGIVVGGGATGTAMQNQNGVVIHLTSVQQGLQLTLAAEGLQITLK